MLEYLVAATIGSVVFILFMLVFLRKDKQGKRGTRLAGCAQHGTGQTCDRCRENPPVHIHPHPPGRERDSF